MEDEDGGSGSYGVVEEDEERGRIEEDALIDEAGPLVQDLLDGKVIGSQPLYAKFLKAKEMFADDQVEVLGREAFDYAKVWVNNPEHGPAFRRELSVDEQTSHNINTA